MADADLQKMPKNAEKFQCIFCDFKCSKKSNYTNHCLTNKHFKAVKYLQNDLQNGIKNATSQIETDTNNYYCKCGNTYKHRQSLYKHKKTCQKEKEINTLESNMIVHKSNIQEPEFVLNFVKQIVENNENMLKQQNEKEKNSQEFQLQMFNQMMEFMKQQCATTNNINNCQIQNNVNNNHFNLQIYLNEKCKNAMTIDQFLDYLQPTIEELEDTIQLGYVEGITRIIMRGLKDLEEELRPFHCTDLKRETMFIKNSENEWEKETEEKPLLLKFVKAVGRKNFNNLEEWKKEHPTWKCYDSKYNDQYNQILINSTSGRTEEEQKASYEKIIKNIAKEVVINKTKKK